MVIFFDVQPVGIYGSDLGFASLNTSFASLIGHNFTFAQISDYLGYAALLIVAIYALIGLFYLVKHKSFAKVPTSIYVLGAYYIIIGLIYVIFTFVAFNRRPVNYGDVFEPSFPSSHTILGLCVPLANIFMLKFSFLKDIFRGKKPLRLAIIIASIVLSSALVVLRTLSGIHWLTDIFGAILYSATLLSALRLALIAIKSKSHSDNPLSTHKSLKI